MPTAEAKSRRAAAWAVIIFNEMLYKNLLEVVNQWAAFPEN